PAARGGRAGVRRGHRDRLSARDAARDALHPGRRSQDGAGPVRDRRRRRRDPRLEGRDGRAHQPRVRAPAHRGLRRAGAGHPGHDRRLRCPGERARAARAAVDGMKVRALQVATIVGVLGLWELTAQMGWVDPLFVPAPSAVASALVRISGGALAGLADTLGKTAVAYVLSVVLGVSAGIVVGSVRLLRDVLSPYVIALYGIPKILILPWIVLLLGYGTTPALFYGVLHGFFPVMVLVMGGGPDVGPTLVTLARS